MAGSRTDQVGLRNPIVAAEKPTSSKDGFYFFLSVQACADFTDGGVDSWPTICPTDAHHATRVGPIIGGSKWNPTLGSPNVQAWLGWAGTYKYSD